jgi:flagellar protein FliO/FliZ
VNTDPTITISRPFSAFEFRACTVRTLTSVTRWLLVVIGCVVLATAQPMSAASPDNAPAPLGPDAIVYPKNTATDPKPAPTRDSDSSRPFILAIALLLAGTGAWILIKRRKAGVLGGRGQRKLQIDETRPLGNRQYLVVADYEGKKFLLGVTPGQIQMLSPLDRDPAKQKDGS